MLVILMGDNRR